MGKKKKSRSSKVNGPNEIVNPMNRTSDDDASSEDPEIPAKDIYFLDLGDIYANARAGLKKRLVDGKNETILGRTIYGYRNAFLNGTPMFCYEDSTEKKTRVKIYRVDGELSDLKADMKNSYGEDVSEAVTEFTDEKKLLKIFSRRDAAGVELYHLCLSIPDGNDQKAEKIADDFVNSHMNARRVSEAPVHDDEEPIDLENQPDRCGVKYFLKTYVKTDDVPQVATNTKDITKELLKNRARKADLFGEMAQPASGISTFCEKLDKIEVTPKHQVLHVLKLKQPGHSDTMPVYQTWITAKFLKDFCEIQRMKRDSGGEVLFSQRKKIMPHINNIASHLSNREDYFMASNFVLAYYLDDWNVTVNKGTLPITPPCSDTQAKDWPAIKIENYDHGFMLVQRNSYRERPMIVIDGQQRMLALEKLNFPDEFHLPCFIYGVNKMHSNERLQDDITKINNTHKFSKRELEGLKVARSDRDWTAEGLGELKVAHILNTNADFDSNPNPFFEKIKVVSTVDKGQIASKKVADMVEEMLDAGVTSGAHLRKRAQEIAKYFRAVQEVFPDEWEASPNKSYLTGGVGLISLGRLYIELVKAEVKYGLDDDRHSRLVQILKGISSSCKWMRNDSKDDTDDAWNNLTNNQTSYKKVTKILTTALEKFMKEENKE